MGQLRSTFVERPCGGAFRLAGSDPPPLTFPMNNLAICGCLAEGAGGEEA